MTDFDTFMKEWLGRRVIDPLLIGRGETAETAYQCVSLIKQYMVETKGLHVDWPGNAIDFWYRTNSVVLQGFTKQADVQRGDIVVLHTLGHNDATQPGHIGIATGNGDPNSIEILEQNGLGSGTGLGRDAIGTRFIARNRVAGTLRPVAVPVTPPYTMNVQPFSGRTRYKVRPGMQKWNLDQPNFDAIRNNPVGSAGDDTYIWVTDWLTRSDLPNYTYYLEDGNLHQGWNSRDLDLSPVPVPAPSLSAPASAPVPVPKAETYDIITTIVYYPTAKDATIDQNAIGTLEPRSYYVYQRDGKMLNLTTDNQKNQDKWINPAMNRIEPPKPAPEPVLEVKPVEAVPVITPTVITEVAAPTEPPKQETDMATDWKQCTPIKVNPNTGQWIPVKYHSTNDMVVNIRSLDGKQPATLPLPPHRELSIVSTFTGPDGETYARDDLLTTSHRFYALRFDMLEKVVPPVVVRTMDVNHDGDVNISDFIDFGNKYFKPGLAIATRTVQTVKKSKFVDGIVAGATKKRNKVQ